MEQKDRNRSCGRAALYIKKTINYKHLTDLHKDNLELICIQASKPKLKPFTVIRWHTPPGSTIQTMNRFEAIPQELDSYHMELIIGKINCYVGSEAPDCSTQKQMDSCDICQYSRTSIIQTFQLSGLASLVPFFPVILRCDLEKLKRRKLH